MQADEEYQKERLDHLWIVAGVCREIGLVEWLDKQAGEKRNLVSIETATMAMALNGLGFSNRQLYLVPQFLPISLWSTCWVRASVQICCMMTVWGAPWIGSPSMIQPSCLQGLRSRARQCFELVSNRVHVDTTSFSVSGAYESDREAGEPAHIAITYGYSRDHRADLKQWMLALVTTHDGDVSSSCAL